MPAKHDNLHFIIIGAARSGTTSLFRNLRAHPQIYMPAEKEICFFSENDRYSKGVQWLFNSYYAGADKEKLLGEATPAYMLFRCVPQRIYNTFPHVKLIAILRNPIYRAYSHYRFAKRLAIETRDFKSAIRYLLDRGPVEDHEIGAQNLEYLMFGDYGRITKNYLEYFSREQIKFVFYEDLSNNPYTTMQEVFSFLGVDEHFSSEIFRKRTNVSGKARFDSAVKLQKWLKSNEKIKSALTKCIPLRVLGAIDMWITANNVKPIGFSGPDKETITMLTHYYKPQVRLFEELSGLRAPWKEFSLHQ